MNQHRMNLAVKTLTNLGNGNEFDRGVAYLANMLRLPVYNGYKQRKPAQVSRSEVCSAAQALLIASDDRDFQRGTLAMASSLLEFGVMVDLIKHATTLRKATPSCEIDGTAPFLLEA